MAQTKTQPPRPVPPVSPSPTPESADPGANPATPATPATQGKPGTRATPATPGTPATPAIPESGDAPTTEAEFLKMTGTSGRAAAKLAQLAATHSENAKVRAYAQTWLNDHQAGSDMLADINTSLKVTLPGNDEPMVQRTYARLRGLHGDLFDQAFLKEMEAFNAAGIARYEAAGNFAKNKNLKAHIDRTLPALRTGTQQLQKLSPPRDETEGNDGRTNPGTSPGTNPGVTPGANPRTAPRANPGTNPRTTPGTTPGTNQGLNPETNPGTTPKTKPGTNPGTSPGTQPGTNR